MVLAILQEILLVKHYIIILFMFTAFASCSRKTLPSRSPEIIYNNAPAAIRNESTTIEERPEIIVNEIKKATPANPASDFPKTIFVDDKAAIKSVDGRLYYDVKGHRYWKNYKDGKYYLYNKSMYNNPDFRPKRN